MNENDIIYYCILMIVATFCIRSIISEYWKGKNAVTIRELDMMEANNE